MKRLTPKQRVQAQYPHAFAYHWTGSWRVYVCPPEKRISVADYAVLGDGRTRADAWADAARRLPK